MKQKVSEQKSSHDSGGYTYMLRCSDGSLYTGWTNNLEKRILSHSRGEGGKYTRSHLPVKLVYFEYYKNRHSAMSREVELKGFTKYKKEQLLGSLSEDQIITIKKINDNLGAKS